MSTRGRIDNRYHDNWSDSVDGNVVRRSAEVYEERTRLQRKKEIPVSRNRFIKRQKARLVFLGIVSAVVLVGLCGVLLSSLSTNSYLASEASAVESEISSLTVANDAREFEIDNAVNLSEVIRIATEELGMVRSSSSQIITYSSSDEEYLQQVAEVPTK